MLDPEKRDRIIHDAFKDKFGPPVETPELALMSKLQKITEDVQRHITPVIKAGGWKDEPALIDMLGKAYQSHLQRLCKDELVFCCTMLLTNKAMDYIRNAPFGEGPVNESPHHD